MKFELKLLQEDKRGSVYLFNYGDQEFLLIFTNAGYYRGGEIHRGRQYNVVISGTQEWNIGEDLKIIVAPEKLIVPAHTPHIMYSRSDSLMIEFREFPLENPVVYYEPYRKIVERSKLEK